VFELDQGVKRSLEIARQLREVLPPAAEETAPEAALAEEPPPDSRGNETLDEPD
jgi:hypothetical protein